MTTAAFALTLLAIVSPANQQLTGIHAAARHGDVKQVRALLDVDPRLVNAPDSLGWTPLHFAAQQGHTALVKLLLASGADIHARLKLGGGSPLHVAATTGHAAVVALLLDSGAGANTPDNSEWTPLHRAALSGNREVAELLLAKGANPQAWSTTSATPIDEAKSSGHAEFARLLTERGRATLPTTDRFVGACRWTSGENSSFSFGCDHEAYRLHLKEPGPVHVAQNFGWETPMVSGEIDATIESGRGLVGIGCLTSRTTGYAGIAGTDGGWAIMRITAGFTQLAGANGPQSTTGLRKTNHLRIACSSASGRATIVTFFVNDRQIGSATDEPGFAPFNGVFLFTNTLPGVVSFERFAARKTPD
jgi:ankyrin repeat protein